MSYLFYLNNVGKNSMNDLQQSPIQVRDWFS